MMVLVKVMFVMIGQIMMKSLRRGVERGWNFEAVEDVQHCWSHILLAAACASCYLLFVAGAVCPVPAVVCGRPLSTARNTPMPQIMPQIARRLWPAASRSPKPTIHIYTCWVLGDPWRNYFARIFSPLMRRMISNPFLLAGFTAVIDNIWGFPKIGDPNIVP